jgi:hypothetical protein
LRLSLYRLTSLTFSLLMPFKVAFLSSISLVVLQTTRLSLN